MQASVVSVAASRMFASFVLQRLVQLKVTSGNSQDFRSYTVTAGLHYLVLHQREDGAKVRTIKFDARGSCGFAPDAQLLAPRGRA